MEKEKKKPDILEALTQVQELTPEMLANKLLDYRESFTHTEIHNPIAMTTIDLCENYFKELKIDSLVKELRMWLRTNYVAYNRQRAREMVEILRSIREQQQKPVTWQEALIGR